REGRRPRHRQEPRGHHLLEQRLPDHQPRHQGAARGPDRRLAHPQAGRLRAQRPAGEVGPADGGDGPGPQGGRDRGAAVRRRRRVPLGHLFPYLNVQMLYGKHLGLRGPVARMLEDGDAKALELQEVVETLQTEAVRDGLLSAQGVYQWFRTRAAGETLTLFGAGGEPAARFTFPRPPDGERLCLADYVRSDDVDDYLP